jgi:hypothetical protein
MSSAGNASQVALFNLNAEQLALSLSMTGLVSMVCVVIVGLLWLRYFSRSGVKLSGHPPVALRVLLVLIELYLAGFALWSILDISGDLSAATKSQTHLLEISSRPDVIGCPRQGARFCCSDVQAMLQSGRYTSCAAFNSTDFLRQAECQVVDEDTNREDRCCRETPGIDEREVDLIGLLWVALLAVIVAACLEAILFGFESLQWSCSRSSGFVLFTDGGAVLADVVCNFLLMGLAARIVASPQECFAEEKLQRAYANAIRDYINLLADFTTTTWILVVIAMGLSTLLLCIRVQFPAFLFSHCASAPFDDEEEDRKTGPGKSAEAGTMGSSPV